MPSSSSATSKASAKARRPSRWNGLTTEERQAERRALLIEAALELLANEGTAGTTVRAVCAQARLNPRYFYESFDELDALIVATFDSIMSDLQARVTGRVAEAGDDVDAAVRAAVTGVVEYVAEDRRRGHVLYVEALGSEALNRRRMQTGFALIELVRSDTARRRGTPEPQEIDRLAAGLIIGGFSEILTAWVGGRLTMDQEALIDNATKLLTAVVRTVGAISD